MPALGVGVIDIEPEPPLHAAIVYPSRITEQKNESALRIGPSLRKNTKLPDVADEG
jgi:hypothetical protein